MATLTAKKKKKLKRIELHEVYSRMRIVQLDDPTLTDPLEIAKAITQQFHILCTKQDVIDYNSLHVELTNSHGDIY